MYPFKIEVSENEVDRLRRKLEDTRLPGREIVTGAGDRYGKTSISALGHTCYRTADSDQRSLLWMGKWTCTFMDS